MSLSLKHTTPDLIPPTLSAHRLGFIFDQHLTLSDQISALSVPCYSHSGQLCCIYSYFDLKTAYTIATALCTLNLITTTRSIS